MGVLKNFDASVVKHDKVSKAGATKYNVIVPGLSYGGTCTTQGCDGFRKQVVCNRKFGSHLVNDDIINEVPKCPCCMSSIAVDVVMLFEAKATLTVVQGRADGTDDAASLIARGDDVVMIGERKESTGTRNVFNANRLVTVDVKPLDGITCALM